MSFSVRFFGLYLLPCFVLACYATVVEVRPVAVVPAGNGTGNATNTKLPTVSVGHPTSAPQNTSAPSVKNGTSLAAGNVSSVTNNTRSPLPAVNNTNTSAPTVVASKVDSSVNITVPSQAAKHDTNTTSPTVGTTSPPHHKKSHSTTIAPQPVTHPHVTVPIKPMKDNILEDMEHPAPRPLQAVEKFNPTFGAIVAAICITTAVGGYVVLMAWRKIQLDRYGNRQMLINEDDFGDIQDEDMRHFEC